MQKSAPSKGTSPNIHMNRGSDLKGSDWGDPHMIPGAGRKKAEISWCPPQSCQAFPAVLEGVR